MTELVLASGSPRRRELLEKLEVPFRVIVPGVDESLDKPMAPRATALAVAMKKATAVLNQLSPGSLVLASDTVVALGDQQFGKPETPVQAEQMLELFSGKTHQVITAVALGEPGRGLDLRATTTEVRFRTLSPEEIRSYVATGEPMDKAGAYGIQGLAADFVASIHGCYFTVVGFPINLVVEMLESTPWGASARLAARSLVAPTFPIPPKDSRI